MSASAMPLVDETRRLVNLAMAGDQTAMVQLVEQYKHRVFRLCYRMLGQREDAEDVSQEAFVRVLRNLPRWDQQREFDPWLMTIAANRCRSQLARRKSRGFTMSLTFAPPDLRWQAHRDAELLDEELQLALQELPDTQRDAFLLFHRQQLSYREIAERLQVPEGTVKTWVHRARRQLVQQLTLRRVVKESGHAS